LHDVGIRIVDDALAGGTQKPGQGVLQRDGGSGIEKAGMVHDDSMQGALRRGWNDYSAAAGEIMDRPGFLWGQYLAPPGRHRADRKRLFPDWEPALSCPAAD